jgi:hypothetical protein
MVIRIFLARRGGQASLQADAWDFLAERGDLLDFLYQYRDGGRFVVKPTYAGGLGNLPEALNQSARTAVDRRGRQSLRSVDPVPGDPDRPL